MDGHRTMILIVGFTCPPTIHFKFITKCDEVFWTEDLIDETTKGLHDSYTIPKASMCSKGRAVASMRQDEAVASS